MDSSFIVEGGHRLSGEIVPQGAKNEALQVICATLLTRETVTLHNVPGILDVQRLIQLLRSIGVKVENPVTGTYAFTADDIDLDYLETEEFILSAAKIRGSILLVGPLLARFKYARIPKPGGDKIGRRRIDTHLIGLEKLGARLMEDRTKCLYHARTEALTGAEMLLDEASVTGTANVLMAATLARGETAIFNAACEPYVVQLTRMLSRMGARIEGQGSNLLRVQGVDGLGGCEHTLQPDMIEVGSFIGLAAMTASELLIKGVDTAELGMIPTVFGRLGVKLEVQGSDLLVPRQDHYEIESFRDGSIMTISDAPWPGFTPDLISIALVVATQAKGSVLIHQKMFESRLFFVDKLIDMGAQIILCDPHRATVIGLDKVHPLYGISMSSPDIRAGVALLIAALSASGTSRIYNIEQIDRGYEHIDTRLRALGARIERQGRA